MVDALEKPRVRVPSRTTDSVQNFLARVGVGTGNQAAATGYGLNPITRNRLQLEWAYRGSWICRQVVDAPAEDMARAGIDIDTPEPGDAEKLQDAIQRLGLWQKQRQIIQWSRLYGGGVGIILIDGQNPSTPLRPETVGKGQFKGILALDRWAVQPSLSETVTELGPDFGQPLFYSITASAPGIPRIKVHYSRVIRLDGEDLPIWQRQNENGWGLSVLEPLWDRLTAFDSTTVGIGQLVYKAHLRTLKIDGLRELIGQGGRALEAVLKQIDLTRAMQTNEGLSLFDAKDAFETHQYSFGGLSEVLVQFAQQLSGAAQIPLVRLFGQSPAGLNATGDADIRNYYDACSSQQEARLRSPWGLLLQVLFYSELGKPQPNGTSFTFRPLWQMSAREKADIGNVVATAIGRLEESAIIARATALKELRNSAPDTGMFGSITDEMIDEAEQEAPQPGEGDLLGEPPAPEEGDLALLTRDGDFKEEEHPRGDDGKFGGSVHVVSSHDEDDNATKVHGVYADPATARRAQQAVTQKLYAAMREDMQGRAPQRRVAHATAVARLTEHGYENALPKLQTLHVGGEEAPDTVHVVHGQVPDADSSIGEYKPVMHSAHSDPKEALGAARTISERTWAKQGETRNGELSDKELKQVARAYNAAAGPEHIVDNDLDFEDSEHVESAIDDWNATRPAADHLRYDQFSNDRYTLADKLSYLTDFRRGEHAGESEQDYFARSAKQSRHEQEIVGRLREAYPAVRERDAAHDELARLREEMFPENEIKPYPGLSKANAYFGDVDGNGVVKAKKYKVIK